MRTLTLMLALTLPGVAHAGARKVPDYELTDAKTTLKSAKKMGFTTKGKAKTYPKKVAIGYFATRYHFKETTVGKDVITVTTLKFGDPHYQMLTDELYAQLVARLEAEGFEVVDKDTVTAAAAYGSLEEKDEVSSNGKRVRFAPTGMKNLPTFSGGPKKAKELAALNQELGTDAVVAAFLNIGLCSVEPTKKTDMRSGTYACLKGDLTMPGINIQFLGGAKGSGAKVKPEWTARWYKAYSPYEYNKRDKLTYDTALIADNSATSVVKNGFWKANGIEGHEEAFVYGSQTIYGDALTMGFEVWDKTNGKARQKAGLTRSEPKLPKTPATAATLALAEKATRSEARTEDATGEVPALPGEVRCFEGSNRIGGKVISTVLVRQSIDGNDMIEDSVTLAEGAPPYRYVSRMTSTGEGNGFEVREAQGTWTGTGVHENGFTTWNTELTLGNGTEVFSRSEVTAAGLTVQSEMKSGDKTIADVLMEAKPLAPEACEEKFATYPVPEGAF